MVQQLRVAPEPLTIKGRIIQAKEIRILESVTDTVCKTKNLDKKNALKYIRNTLPSAKKLGDAFAGNLRRPGYIVQLDDSLYLALGNDLNSLFYASTKDSDFDFFSESPSANVLGFKDFTVDISQLSMSQHYMERAQERFDMNATKAKQTAREVLSGGTYICMTQPDSADWKPNYMFCRDNVVVHLALDCRTLITIYKVTRNPINDFPDVYQHLVRKTWIELNKAAAEQRSGIRAHEKMRLETNLRVAEIELELFSVRKPEKRDELNLELLERGRALREEFSCLKEKATRLRHLALSLATFI